MKISNEIKIGILAIITIAASVWGYKFLKGQNLLSRSNIFKVRYENISQLEVSAPVLISGFQIGTVSNVRIDPNDMKTVLVELDVKKSLKIPKTATAYVISTGLMGQKAIEIDVPYPCSGDNCAKNNDYLQGGQKGLVQSMLGDTDVDVYLQKFQSSILGALDTINKRIEEVEDPEGIIAIIHNLQLTTENIAEASQTLSDLMSTSERDLSAISSNMASITSNLRDNNETITKSLYNVEVITDQLAAGDLENTLRNASSATASADDAMEKLNSTLEELESTSVELKSFISGINEGEGTIGKLAKDEELYDNLSRMSQNLDLLLQDFRLNPKRYVNVSVFGKKGKEYTLPEEDPAFPNDSLYVSPEENEQKKKKKRKRNKD